MSSLYLILYIVLIMTSLCNRLYPVDKSRVNEFGESFEDQKLHKD